LEFIVSVINNGGGYYTRQTYINECRRLGFPILKPDINRSEYLYRPEYPGSAEYPGGTSASGRKTCRHHKERSRYTDSSTGEAYLNKRAGLRVGLMQFKGIKKEFLLKLVEERKRNGSFISFTDFIRRINPGVSELAVLIKSGCLDSISAGFTRPELFWQYYNTVNFNGSFISPAVPSMVGNYSDELKIKYEYETYGLYISIHPLEIFEGKLETAVREFTQNRTSRINSALIPYYVNREVILAGLLVTGKEVLTRNRERMVFVSFEDTHSVFETVLFPEAFKKFRRILDTGGIYIIKGRVDNDMGTYSIHVEGIVRVYTPAMEDCRSTYNRCAV